MEFHLKFIGYLLLILALVHLQFPKKFNWKKEFENVSLLNRQMMYIHTFFIGLVLVLMGLLCITSFNELINSKLGKKVCLGFATFWVIRLYIQFFGYSPKLWQGKRFETVIHFIFSIFWAYLSIIFFWIGLSN